MSLTNYTFTQICQMLVVPAFFATLKMLLISGVFIYDFRICVWSYFDSD